jgi:hypothetical protein
MGQEGLLIANPTPGEQAEYFDGVFCDHGHSVTGKMLIVGAERYPFAVCDDSVHRDFLVLWPPYYCGFDSANYEFV